MTLGEQIVTEAWRQYDAWERKWGDDLEGISPEDRTRVYTYMCDGIDIDLAKSMVERDHQPGYTQYTGYRP